MKIKSKKSEEIFKKIPLIFDYSPFTAGAPDGAGEKSPTGLFSP